MAARAKTRRVAVEATLWRYPGTGGWTFAPVPPRLAPQWTEGWGRTPVVATVDGHTWKTSVWRSESGRVDLPVPALARGEKGDGDVVAVTLVYDRDDA